MSLFIISFIAGAITILAPCVLPLLPVIVGGSITGAPEDIHKKRAFVVAGSLGVSVLLFTLLLKVSTVFIMVPESFWKWVSGTIIIFFGLVTLFPELWEKIPVVGLLSRSSNKLMGEGYQKKSVWGDIIVGASLGPVFSTCSPTYFLVLATVLPASPLIGILYLLSYIFGLCLSLLVVVFIGQRITNKLDFAANPHGIFKRVLGAVFLIVGVAIITGFDKKIETSILNAGYFDITKIEQKLLQKSSPSNNLNINGEETIAQGSIEKEQMKQEEQKNQTSNLSSDVQPQQETFMTLDQKKKLYPQVPELVTPDGYINTKTVPLKIRDHIGKKVVLVDFWTYSCINCQRTLPYLNDWYEKYKDQGFEIVSVHTPEFSFEKVQSNVEDAVKRFGIQYPVVLDSEYKTWAAFKNQYWPRKYLVDIDGYIVYDHIGEGSYDETEKEIQKALRERASRLHDDVHVTTSLSTPSGGNLTNDITAQSPETYFGADRNEFLDNGMQGVVGEQNLNEPIIVLPNKLYLVGKWSIQHEYAETSTDVGTQTVGSDRIDYTYNAKRVYFVAGTSGATISVEVQRDGKPISSSIKGKDIFYMNGKSYVKIKENRLYNLIEDTDRGVHLLELIISNPGLQAYTFTFG